MIFQAQPEICHVEEVVLDDALGGVIKAV